MNIVEALNVALPEIPERLARQKHVPKMDPRLIGRAHVLDGVPVVRVLVPDNHEFYTLPPEYWEVLQLFDGERTYEEIAELFTARTGMALSGTGCCSLPPKMLKPRFGPRPCRKRMPTF